MKLGFICLNVPGHLNPMTALARQLQARGHDVVFLYSSGAAGLPFVPGPEKERFGIFLPPGVGSNRDNIRIIAGDGRSE
jgi:hypothetical protein